ncbi:hypothetical protein CONLIGDRAFT_163898 [Coniochaeta ligniaria NRRL 30616]|uniref:Zn(2)-C6 fungal-type domain-containing protein n=1 Tax=Coniochaeta ligniaria NRRL 30616 TaxID=1408157 RepID=A0A1J7J0D2_9PEZI|nr:hypothetical protein CONLIGDRAFT_163898 [Coniochaeta ligniaria NRRL 30616]
MVYCGKASKGCQHCRTRRIKCDKLRPDCSQCVRAGKQCPGYRDQLSLMFRDENTKVIQKAHAQWGVPGYSDSPSTSSGSPSSAESPFSFVNADGTPIPVAPISRRSSSAQQALVATPRISKAVQPTMFERGIQFYIDRYILGYPQEPKTAADLQNAPWMSQPDVADVMAAVGLSGLSNLTGDEELDLAARQKYGVVLRKTAKSIQNPAALDPRTAMRVVVLLAMFEVVQGKSETAGIIRAHIMGAAALLSSFVPTSKQPTAAFRGIIQLCFSMLIPCHTLGVSVPKAALEWILQSRQSLPPEDKSSAELLLTLARFLQLSAGLHGLSLTDIQPGTRELISDAMLIETKLAEWEEQHQQPGSRWAFSTEEADFPPESAFRGRYHVYVNGMWSARVWNHYRWARIMVNQTILGLDDKTCSLGFRDRHLETIRRMADELLVSLPTHFRHPRLTRAHRDLIDRTCILPPGTAGGVGSAGVPSLLVQLQVAGCAPGVPSEYGEWALGVLETIWSETGMLQAQTLAAQLRGDLEKRNRVKMEMVEVKEERMPWPTNEPLAFRSGH